MTTNSQACNTFATSRTTNATSRRRKRARKESVLKTFTTAAAALVAYSGLLAIIITVTSLQLGTNAFVAPTIAGTNLPGFQTISGVPQHHKRVLSLRHKGANRLAPTRQQVGAAGPVGMTGESEMVMSDTPATEACREILQRAWRQPSAPRDEEVGPYGERTDQVCSAIFLGICRSDCGVVQRLH